MTYVLLTKTENPWIEALNKNGFSISPVSGNTPYEVRNSPYKISGGIPRAHFNLKTTSGFIYSNRTFDDSGSVVIDSVGGLLSHMGSTLNFWIQYV